MVAIFGLCDCQIIGLGKSATVSGILVLLPGSYDDTLLAIRGPSF